MYVDVDVVAVVLFSLYLYPSDCYLLIVFNWNGFWLIPIRTNYVIYISNCISNRNYLEFYWLIDAIKITKPHSRETSCIWRLRPIGAQQRFESIYAQQSRQSSIYATEGRQKLEHCKQKSRGKDNSNHRETFINVPIDYVHFAYR